MYINITPFQAHEIWRENFITSFCLPVSPNRMLSPAGDRQEGILPKQPFSWMSPPEFFWNKIIPPSICSFCLHSLNPSILPWSPVLARVKYSSETLLPPFVSEYWNSGPRELQFPPRESHSGGKNGRCLYEPEEFASQEEMSHAVTPYKTTLQRQGWVSHGQHHSLESTARWYSPLALYLNLTLTSGLWKMIKRSLDLFICSSTQCGHIKLLSLLFTIISVIAILGTSSHVWLGWTVRAQALTQTLLVTPAVVEEMRRYMEWTWHPSLFWRWYKPWASDLTSLVPSALHQTVDLQVPQVRENSKHYV